MKWYNKEHPSGACELNRIFFYLLEEKRAIASPVRRATTIASLQSSEIQALIFKDEVLNSDDGVLDSEFAVLMLKFRVLILKFEVPCLKFRVLSLKDGVLNSDDEPLSLKDDVPRLNDGVAEAIAQLVLTS